MKKIVTIMAAAMLLLGSFSAQAADGFTRGKGVTARIGVGAPASLELGLGYQFCPQFSLTAEAYSFSGLTAAAGVLDARYYVLDQAFTPFVDVRAGYGIMGKDMSYRDCYDYLGSVSAGISWRRFDLGAGVIYDPFHKLSVTANLSWTIRFGR